MLRVPYFADPLEALRRLSRLGPVTLLDSGGSERGRWDILSAAASRELRLPAAADRAQVDRFLTDLLALENSLGRATPPALPGCPFSGGLLGFFSYELGRRLRGLPARIGVGQPLAVVRYHPWAVLQDHHSRRSYLVHSEGDASAEALHLAGLLHGPRPPAAPPFAIAGAFTAPWRFADYARRFARVMQYIAAGDCYQINLGQPFTARYRGDPVDAYARLRGVAQAPFSALFPLDTGQALLCLSPERFLTVDGGRVETRPIKGTRPRDRDPVRDREQAAALLDSAKERAENLMIVDLLRNDIGRYCATGSVRAEQLFSLESYATVHHLVSTVTGRLRDDVSPLQLLLGCLPGGSITGAPKHRAMQLIDELEAAPRESWCGTVFARSGHGRLDSNILIRTLFADGDTLTCWAGGGLVADSRAEDEYRELEHKIGALLRALEGPG